MLQGGLLSWRDEEAAYPSVKCHHHPLPLRARGRKAEGTRPLQGRGEEREEREGGGGGSNKISFMIQVGVREDFPVSRTSLARLKAAAQPRLGFLYPSSGLCLCFMSWKVTRFYSISFQDTLKCPHVGETSGLTQEVLCYDSTFFMLVLIQVQQFRFLFFLFFKKAKIQNILTTTKQTFDRRHTAQAYC